MKISFQSWFLLASLLVSSHASALINGELMFGTRSGSLDVGGASSDLDATPVKIGVHVDPIPLIPISFGVGFSSLSLSGKDQYESGSGTELGFEVKAWIPMVPIITPYARLGYIFLGNYAFDKDILGIPYKSAFDVSGTVFAVGAEWSPLPLIGIHLEITQGNLELDPTEIKVNGITSTSNVKADFTYSEYLLGVSAGI